MKLEEYPLPTIRLAVIHTFVYVYIMSPFQYLTCHIVKEYYTVIAPCDVINTFILHKQFGHSTRTQQAPKTTCTPSPATQPPTHCRRRPTVTDLRNTIEILLYYNVINQSEYHYNIIITIRMCSSSSQYLIELFNSFAV